MLTSTYKKVIKYQFLKKDFFQLLHYENAVLFMKGKNNRTVFLNTCLGWQTKRQTKRAEFFHRLSYAASWYHVWILYKYIRIMDTHSSHITNILRTLKTISSYFITSFIYNYIQKKKPIQQCQSLHQTTVSFQNCNKFVNLILSFNTNNIFSRLLKSVFF